MERQAVVSSDPKKILNIIKQSEYLDEEILSKANNKLYAPDEFSNALKNVNMASQFFYMHLHISSLSYPHLELCNLISSLKIKPNIIGISEIRLQKEKEPITNISLPNVDEHTPLSQIKEEHFSISTKALNISCARTQISLKKRR